MAVLFNTTLRGDDGANVLAATVCQYRARRFMNFLQDHIDENLSVEDVQYD
jgi:hypothetical protein